MDLNFLAQSAYQVVTDAALPSALAVAAYGLRQAQARWKFNVSQKLQDGVTTDIAAVVNLCVGWGRAKLASGEMQLGHVTTGNALIDQMATAGLAMLSANAKASGITADDLARHIVGGIGHALGNDPNVPTVAVPVAPQGPVAVVVADGAPTGGVAGAVPLAA
jgi:hypothetical protein